ncbi:class F sortase [Streptomyces antarcticus]|uniref:class F sortase n=1 Tax=Streptomyces antarcticus TaxID=2996458 RepID=UPI00226DD621|nr:MULTISPECIES: class F sortase [unclassified Streptomyces]MCY0944840.1 class F sortase [Streptomyces sp. H34-AA3]MCZ4083398.1 class F sortase [Streptomyces sp. H34-S5]
MKPAPTRVTEPGASTARPRRRAAGPLAATALAALLLAGCSGQDPAAPSTPQGQAPQGQAQPGGAPAAGGADTPAGEVSPGGPGASPGAGASGGTGTGTGGGQAKPALARSAPQKISIPSLGVSSSLETLRQNADGTMETPKDPGLAGWYEPGPTPGSQGPAVIAGHVTWNGASAVFEKLKTMKAGDTIKVTRQDNKTVTFTVNRVAEYPKAEFPTLEVYKNLDHAGLRLVTCGGDFDPKKNYYNSNVVVFAQMTGTA